MAKQDLKNMVAWQDSWQRVWKSVEDISASWGNCGMMRPVKLCSMELPSTCHVLSSRGRPQNVYSIQLTAASLSRYSIIFCSRYWSNEYLSCLMKCSSQDTSNLLWMSSMINCSSTENWRTGPLIRLTLDLAEISWFLLAVGLSNILFPPLNKTLILPHPSLPSFSNNNGENKWNVS